MASLAASCVAVGAACAQELAWRPVKTPLIAQPLPPEAYGEREIRPDEPFMVQRLLAVESVTLRGDVLVDATMGQASLPTGSRLFLSIGPGPTEYWCGIYRPRAASEFMGRYKVQWICLRDEDGDQAFDTYYTTRPNAGAFLPSFDRVQGPHAIGAAVPYTKDAAADRAYFEMAIAWQKTFNIYNRLFFWTKVRLGDEGEWSNATSDVLGVMGGNVSVGGKPPIPVNTGAAVFSVTERQSDVLKVKPQSVKTGLAIYAIETVPGR